MKVADDAAAAGADVAGRHRHDRTVAKRETKGAPTSRDVTTAARAIDRDRTIHRRLRRHGTRPRAVHGDRGDQRKATATASARVRRDDRRPDAAAIRSRPTPATPWIRANEKADRAAVGVVAGAARTRDRRSRTARRSETTVVAARNRVAGSRRARRSRTRATTSSGKSRLSVRRTLGSAHVVVGVGPAARRRGRCARARHSHRLQSITPTKKAALSGGFFRSSIVRGVAAISDQAWPRFCNSTRTILPSFASQK